MEELDALMILSGLPLVGSIKVQFLLEHFGSACAALAAGANEWAQLPGIGSKVVDSFTHWRSDPSWEKNKELAMRYGVSIIPFSDPRYPQSLLSIPDFPILLYVKGEIKSSDRNAVGVVGTREATPYGLAMTQRFTQSLASSFTIVSGLARGVDTIAHRAALSVSPNGRTLAVIGSGLANIYPRENVGLANEIALRGALISEFPMLTPPDRQNFPQRNRIVSALSLGVLLIEAPAKSGALLTLGRAVEYGKKVWALSGRVDTEHFRGNHAWIKSGQARLVESPDEITEQLGYRVSASARPINGGRAAALDPEERAVFELIGVDTAFDEILARSQIPVYRLNMLIMSLLLKKTIIELPGKQYARI